MKKQTHRTLSFESTLSPQAFIKQTHDIVISENYRYFSRNENGFLFEIGANHGGKEFFQCEVLPNENGGSTINGTIVHQSWYADSDQSIFEKIRDNIIFVLVCIIFFPILVFIGIYNLISHLFKKEKLSPYERKAIDFMTNKMGCLRK